MPKGRRKDLTRLIDPLVVYQRHFFGTREMKERVIHQIELLKSKTQS